MYFLPVRVRNSYSSKPLLPWRYVCRKAELALKAVKHAGYCAVGPEISLFPFLFVLGVDGWTACSGVAA